MSTPPSPSARVAALFDRVAPTYESVGVPWFEPIADGLVRAVAPQPGERAVDLGCGRGAALVRLGAVADEREALHASSSRRMPPRPSS